MNAATDTLSSLLGSWRLESWVISYSDGRPNQYPFGESPEGSLLYTPEGRMLAAVARGDRQALSVSVPHRASAAEKAAAFDSFFSYGGRFHIDGDSVVHLVDIALNPNFVGTEQRRHMHFEGDRLILSAREKLSENEETQLVRTHRLCWRAVTREEPL